MKRLKTAFVVTFITTVCSTAHAESTNVQPTLSPADQYVLGRSFFTIPWIEAPGSTTARDGLGPHFNANTCRSCHVENGSGATVNEQGEPLRALLFKLTQPTLQEQRWQLSHLETPFHDSVPDPVYGVQIAINGNAKVKPEGATHLRIKSHLFKYPDGQRVTLSTFVPYVDQLAYGPLSPATTISLRQPPALVGMNYLEQTADSDILAWADPNDDNHDGISGRPNWLNRSDSDTKVLGRYNWKASEATLRGQIANAAAHDMGLTNPLYPHELCNVGQQDCQAAPVGRATAAGTLDLPEFRLEAITYYVRHTNNPVSNLITAGEAGQGRDIFNQVGCSACHRETLHTQQGEAYHPYSDYLLHDMGAALADQRPEFLATPRDYRTAPLWGVGQRVAQQQRFLHDARARTPEEAILWHGGEAKAVVDRFIQLKQEQRESLLHFLEQL